MLALGVAAGAGASLLIDDRDEAVTAGEDDGTARLQPRPGPVTIVLGGELRAGWALAEAIEDRSAGVVGAFAEVLGDAALSVVGLSAAVLDEPPEEVGGVAWVPGTALDGLVADGIDVVSVASERALDLGPEGLSRTLAAAEGRDVAVLGLGADEDEAYAPVVRRVGGQSVAVIAATQRLAPERIATDTAGPGAPGVASAKRVDRLVAEVRAVSEVADVVVVYLHWGEDGETCPTTGQQELAVALVDAGSYITGQTIAVDGGWTAR